MSRVDGRLEGLRGSLVIALIGQEAAEIAGRERGALGKA